MKSLGTQKVFLHRFYFSFECFFFSYTTHFKTLFFLSEYHYLDITFRQINLENRNLIIAQKVNASKINKEENLEVNINQESIPLKLSWEYLLYVLEISKETQLPLVALKLASHDPPPSPFGPPFMPYTGGDGGQFLII